LNGQGLLVGTGLGLAYLIRQQGTACDAASMGWALGRRGAPKSDRPWNGGEQGGLLVLFGDARGEVAAKAVEGKGGHSLLVDSLIYTVKFIPISRVDSYMILILFLVLALVLLLAYCSHPMSLRVLREGFAALPDFSKPSIDLAKNADFMTFLQFNQSVCAMWDDVIADVMKNDQVSQTPAERLPKAQYVAQLEQQAATVFVKCAPFDATSTLSVLLAAVPESPQVYKNTFAFLNSKLSDSLEKLHTALDSANTSVSAFADYEPFEDCKAAVAAAVAAAKATPSPSVKELEVQQQKQTNQVLARIKNTMVELPALQKGLQTVLAKYNELKEYKKKSESGEIFNEVT